MEKNSLLVPSCLIGKDKIGEARHDNITEVNVMK
jgi:hypothetical protein